MKLVHLKDVWHLLLLSLAVPIAVFSAHICSKNSGCSAEKMVSAKVVVDGEAGDASSDLSIVINIPAAEMTLFEGGQELLKRRVAIGSAGFPTPEKESFIKVIEWNPWWYPPKAPWAKGEKPTPPGPRNPLGPVKMRVGSASEILMHGTNKSWSIGRPASHGCMRMHNDEASSLAWFLQRRYSVKNDPSFLDTYKKRSGSTFRVELDREIPVKLIYDPVVVRDGNLILYPDHYNKISSSRKPELIKEIISSGLSLEYFDDAKIEKVVKEWPSSKKEIPLSDLLIDAPRTNLASAPECS